MNEHYHDQLPQSMTRQQMACQFQRLAAAYAEAGRIRLDQVDQACVIAAKLAIAPRTTMRVIGLAIIEKTLLSSMNEILDLQHKAKRWYEASRDMMRIE